MAIRILIILSIGIVLLTLIYCIVMLRRNWDVMVRDQTCLMIQSVVMAALLILLLLAYYNVYQLWPGNMWVGLALFISSVFMLYASIMAFRKVRNIKERGMEVLKTLICVMEAGDPNLDGHSVHVHNIVDVFYDYLPVLYQHRLNLENLRYASLFLDMGKLGIPRSVLTKSGKLTKDEMDLIRRHPEICVKIIGSLGSFSMISDWILYHHERVDGNGYHGLKGGEIPLASRVIAIADTYSALTMDRTYKASLSYDEAILEIKQAAGTQLDSDLVGYFCEIPKHRLEDCIADVKMITSRYQDEHFGE